MSVWNDQFLNQPAFSFGRDPMMICEPSGLIRATNLAFDRSFGRITGNCSGIHIAELEKLLDDCLSDHIYPYGGIIDRHMHSTELFFACETVELSVAISTVRCVDVSGVERELAISEVPLLHLDSGLCFGSMLTLSDGTEITRLSRSDDLNQAISHQLMWTVYASSYDQIIPQLFFYRDALKRHLIALANDAISSIIDIGAGTGIQTLALLNRGKSVTSVDPSKAMIRRLKSKVFPEFSASCHVLEKSAHSLPEIPSSSFDAATILLAFFDMDEPWLALREIERILTPGGLIVLTEPKECFNVERLMVAGKKDLEASGKFTNLKEHWDRIESIAPLIADRIQGVLSGRGRLQSTTAWNAENVFHDLATRGYSELQIIESHLGNCATISGRKPI